jgi:hypothetical protein
MLTQPLSRFANGLQAASPAAHSATGAGPTSVVCCQMWSMSAGVLPGASLIYAVALLRARQTVQASSRAIAWPVDPSVN